MISGDRSVSQGKKAAFWYTLEEFHKHWDRIDIICPRTSGANREIFGNVFFHPNPKNYWSQKDWIRTKGMELINTHHHDVITAHDYPPFFHGVGARHLNKRTGIPYALEIHHIVGYPMPASLIELIGRIQSRFYLPWASKKATAVRVVNRGTKDVLAGWGIEKEKISIVPSFYLDHHLLVPDATIPKTYDIACGGRLVPNKGIAEVIRAIAALPDVTLLILGDGPLLPSLQALATSLNVANRVHFAGWSEESADVYRKLQSAKIFVMNSKSEGGPRIALEAMALGVPLITTKVGLMPDVIRNGTNGFFVTGDAKDLTDTMQRLLADESLRERVGKEARKILNEFERETLIKRYAEFLQSHARHFDSSLAP